MNTWQKRILTASLALNIVFCGLGGYYLYQRGGFAYIAARFAAWPEAPASNTAMPYYKDKTSLFAILPPTANTVLFVGDSLTDGCEWHELLQNPRVKNRGISADTTYGVLSRLDDIAKEKPAKIFLMIGVNDLWQGASLPDITANLAKTLTELRQRTPDTAIFLQSVLPINTIKFTASTNLTSNSQITALNKELKQLAGSHNATYIDLYAVMVSADNQLPGDLTTDGIHLNGKGYQRWKSAIRHYVE